MLLLKFFIMSLRCASNDEFGTDIFNCRKLFPISSFASRSIHYYISAFGSKRHLGLRWWWKVFCDTPEPRRLIIVLCLFPGRIFAARTRAAFLHARGDGMRASEMPAVSLACTGYII